MRDDPKGPALPPKPIAPRKKPFERGKEVPPPKFDPPPPPPKQPEKQ